MLYLEKELMFISFCVCCNLLESNQGMLRVLSNRRQNVLESLQVKDSLLQSRLVCYDIICQKGT